MPDQNNSDTLTLTVTGTGLTRAGLVSAARAKSQVSIAPEATGRMTKSRETVTNAIAEGRAVYGLTTGLGSRAGQMLDTSTIKDFPAHMVRGRAQAMGAPLPADVVRAAMLARLNSFCLGHAGVRPEIAMCLRDWHNAGLTPAVGSIGSIGASDLCQGADMALALIGEGYVLNEDGERIPALPAMKAVGLTPLHLAEKDGLPLIGHSALSLGRMACAIADIERLADKMEDVAALGLFAFGANPSAFDPRALAASGLHHDAAAAARILEKLASPNAESALPGRRLQDPLSLRHIPQLLGGLRLAIDIADPIVNAHINGSPDNPCVLSEDDEILSVGNYHTVSLALAAELCARALAPVATASVARVAKLLTARFTNLPQYLAADGMANNGLAPAMKITEALNTELQERTRCRPAPLSFCADGVEDIGTTAPGAAADLEAAVALAFDLAAWEMVTAATAAEARGAPFPHGIERIRAYIRRHVDPVGDDRPLARDVEALSTLLRKDEEK